MPEGVPLLADIPLECVRSIDHGLDAGFRGTPIVGLEGTLQQRSARRSHILRIEGELRGDTARDDLGKLQGVANEGAELNFAADITAALELSKVVVTSFVAREIAGHPNRFHYVVELAESPPLPPPAQVEPFGGLGDFGVGDLGFDTDILGDIADLAGEVAGAVDAAMDVMDQLSSLVGLANLGDLSGLLQPMSGAVSETRTLGSDLDEATDELTRELES